MTGFTDQVRARLPDALHLPEAFAITFDWLEGQGFSIQATMQDTPEFQQQALLIYPPDMANAPGASHVAFRVEAGPPMHAPPPEALARVASVATIAGDGGSLAFWLDDLGKQQIVVFDHGWPYVMAADPLVALQFLAIGYPEPAALTDAGMTAAEAAAFDGAPPPVLPHAYRAFLEQQFGVTIPPRASDLGITIPDGTAQDPMRDWYSRIDSEAALYPMPGQHPDHPFLLTRALREALDDETIRLLRDSYDYVTEET